MSTTTDKLALFKYDPSTDGAQTFNIQKALNDNWDKLDDAVKEILITLANKSNSVHADRHAAGGADPITPESIGAAPGGYGIGETPKYIADANDAVKNGRYAVDKSTLNLPGPIGDLWNYTYLDVYTGNRPDVYIKQTMTSPYQGWHQCEITRCFYDARGGWQPWEWVNPPMLLDTEYRTTERYQGKPVYTKTVDCGSCPASGYKDIEYGTAGIVLPIRCEGTWSYSGRSTIPFESTDADQLHIGALGNIIRVKTGGKDFSSYKCTATVYYTKATD